MNFVVLESSVPQVNGNSESTIGADASIISDETAGITPGAYCIVPYGIPLIIEDRI
jgi:hypothetical protein